MNSTTDMSSSGEEEEESFSKNESEPEGAELFTMGRLEYSGASEVEQLVDNDLPLPLKFPFFNPFIICSFLTMMNLGTVIQLVSNGLSGAQLMFTMKLLKRYSHLTETIDYGLTSSSSAKGSARECSR